MKTTCKRDNMQIKFELDWGCLDTFAFFTYTQNGVNESGNAGLDGILHVKSMKHRRNNYTFVKK